MTLKSIKQNFSISGNNLKNYINFVHARIQFAVMVSGGAHLCVMVL
jgi:hypothetical protein